jgi:hypothetical protein
MLRRAEIVRLSASGRLAIPIRSNALPPLPAASGCAVAGSVQKEAICYHPVTLTTYDRYRWRSIVAIHCGRQRELVSSACGVRVRGRDAVSHLRHIGGAAGAVGVQTRPRRAQKPGWEPAPLRARPVPVLRQRCGRLPQTSSFIGTCAARRIKIRIRTLAIRTLAGGPSPSDERQGTPAATRKAWPRQLRLSVPSLLVQQLIWRRARRRTAPDRGRGVRPGRGRG